MNGKKTLCVPKYENIVNFTIVASTSNTFLKTITKINDLVHIHKQSYQLIILKYILYNLFFFYLCA